MNFKTIIFDLGGVVIDLDPDMTAKAFGKLSNKTTKEVYTLYQQHPEVFLDYEKGLISRAAFRDGVNKIFDTNMTDLAIDQAWNAMLVNLPLARLELLSALRNKYKVIILSNTNTIHVDSFNQSILLASSKPDLSYFADEVYFSHELKMRKPDDDIFLEVLNRSKTKADEALFLDDTLPNLETANRLGIQTMHISHPDQIFNLQSYV